MAGVIRKGSPRLVAASAWVGSAALRLRSQEKKNMKKTSNIQAKPGIQGPLPLRKATCWVSLIRAPAPGSNCARR
jgi:hypothetical protein